MNKNSENGFWDAIWHTVTPLYVPEFLGFAPAHLFFSRFVWVLTSHFKHLLLRLQMKILLLRTHFCANGFRWLDRRMTDGRRRQLLILLG